MAPLIRRKSDDGSFAPPPSAIAGSSRPSPSATKPTRETGIMDKMGF